jgi:hypothetical protein
MLICFARGETNFPRRRKPPNRKSTNMGDKSPKSVNKKATQKQSKAASANHKKQQAVAAKQASDKKR